MKLNILMENYIYDEIIKSNSINLLIIYPIIDGISGTFNRPYSSFPEYSHCLYNRRLDNRGIRCEVFYERRDYLKYFIERINWMSYLIKWKILNLFIS